MFMFICVPVHVMLFECVYVCLCIRTYTYVCAIVCTCMCIRMWCGLCTVYTVHPLPFPPYREAIPALVHLTRVTPLPLEVAHQFLPRLATFCILYSLALLSIHDADFYHHDTTGLMETAMFSQARLTEMCALLRDATVAITLVTHQRRAAAKFWGTQREEEMEVSQMELNFILQVCSLCW